ncbi:hypothetical protein DB347_25395 [Opitutaceae bacterium EW11]|nr:hypothetical protein DB347_25395 [Opitutaceae bacterium EW11]
MTRDVNDILRELRQFSADDFDYMKGAPGPERLHALCAEVEALPEPAVVFPEFFALMERLSESELGTPGPLVHTMEKYTGSYERLLAQSIIRRPVDLSVWMVNRVLNGGAGDRDAWMKLLETASNHPDASELARDQAKHFIEFQSQR